MSLYQSANDTQELVGNLFRHALQSHLTALSTIAHHAKVSAATVSLLANAASRPKSIVQDVNGKPVGVTPIHLME